MPLHLFFSFNSSCLLPYVSVSRSLACHFFWSLPWRSTSPFPSFASFSPLYYCSLTVYCLFNFFVSFPPTSSHISLGKSQGNRHHKHQDFDLFFMPDCLEESPFPEEALNKYLLNERNPFPWLLKFSSLQLLSCEHHSWERGRVLEMQLWPQRRILPKRFSQTHAFPLHFSK